MGCGYIVPPPLEVGLEAPTYAKSIREIFGFLASVKKSRILVIVLMGTPLGKDEIGKMKDEGKQAFFENRERSFLFEINEKSMEYCISS